MDGFRNQVFEWANEQAFTEILDTIDKISNPNDRVKHYFALLSWAMPKVGSVDYLGETARDITVVLKREPERGKDL